MLNSENIALHKNIKMQTPKRGQRWEVAAAHTLCTHCTLYIVHCTHCTNLICNISYIRYEKYINMQTPKRGQRRNTLQCTLCRAQIKAQIQFVMHHGAKSINMQTPKSTSLSNYTKTRLSDNWWWGWRAWKPDLENCRRANDCNISLRACEPTTNNNNHNHRRCEIAR